MPLWWKTFKLDTKLHISCFKGEIKHSMLFVLISLTKHAPLKWKSWWISVDNLQVKLTNLRLSKTFWFKCSNSDLNVNVVLAGVGSSGSCFSRDGIQHGMYRLSSQPEDDTTVRRSGGTIPSGSCLATQILGFFEKNIPKGGGVDLSFSLIDFDLFCYALIWFGIFPCILSSKFHFIW